MEDEQKNTGTPEDNIQFNSIQLSTLQSVNEHHMVGGCNSNIPKVKLKQGQTSKKPKKEDKGPTISDVLENFKDFQGQGNMPGRNFQSKILALYMCKGRDLKNFHLATEVQSAGKFDDLVFSYEDDGGKIKYSLLQAKQILKKDSASNTIPKITLHDLKSPTNPTFSLKVYFESYLKILLDNPGSYIELLILFTNADFDFSKVHDIECPSKDPEDQKETNIVVRKICSQERSLIPTNTYQLLILPKDIQEELTKKDVVREQRLSEFLEKLIYAVDQPDYNAMDATIKAELSDQFNLLQSDDMFNEVLGKVWNVYSQNRGRAIEGKIEQKDFISTMFLSGLRFQSHPKGIDYSDFFTASDEVADILEDESRFLIGIHSSTPVLTSIMVAQALKHAFSERKHPEQYFAIIDDHLLVSQKERVEYTFKHRKTFVLVVVWRPLKTVPVVLLSRLVDTAKTANKRLVFISESQSEFLANGGDSEDWGKFQASVEFADVSEKAIDCFMDSKALLQGEEVKWSEIMSIEDFKTLETNLNIINDSLVHRQLSIGKPIGSLDDLKRSYIGRTFEWQLTSSKEFLQHIPSSQIIVFSPKVKECLKNYRGEEDIETFQGDKDVRRKVFMMRSDKDFQIICDMFPEKNVYWLSTSNNLMKLRKKAENYLIDDNELADNGVKVNVIVGEPGMGKSMMLTKIASLVKQRADFWVVRINLLDSSELLSALKDKSDFDLEDVKGLVFKLEKLIEPFEQELFSYYLTETDKTCFFVDGFDDICPIFEDVVIKLLNYLECTNSRMWVTSRPHCQKTLEKKLSCCTYCLQEFSVDDQRAMLATMYDKPGNHTAEAFTNKLMDEFAKPSFRFVSQCLKIPLFTRIIGDIYRKDFQKFCKRPDIRIIQKVGNTLELYDKVIKKKCEFYMQEKEGGDLNKPHVQRRIQNFYDKFTDIHKNLAVQLLFPDELNIFIDKTLLENVREIDQMINVGILVDTSDNRSNLSFVHRSFAEYFVAKVLAQVVMDKKFSLWTKSSRQFKAVIRFWKNRYFDENHHTLRIFFDRLLAEGSPLLMAVLNDDVQMVKELVEENPGRLSECDKLHRNSMHLAASYSRYYYANEVDEASDDQSMMAFLWKYRNRIQFFKKDLMGYQVFRYAIGSVIREPGCNTVNYLDRKLREEYGQSTMNKMIT